MKAIVCTGYGPPEVLQLKEVATPTPARNEVRIKILATAVTASECLVRGLKLPLRYRLLVRLLFGFKAPRRSILGLVLAGEIDALGQNVSTFKVADPVFGFTQRKFGTYAQYVCWPASSVLAPRERYDVIFDAVGRRKSARALADAQRSLIPGGKVASVDDAFPRPVLADLVVLKELAESGSLKAVIDRTYPLEEMVAAHRVRQRAEGFDSRDRAD